MPDERDDMKDGMTPAAMAALLAGDLKNFVAASTPGGIEAQEAAGQAEVVRDCNRLPKRMIRCERSDFEALGFEFIGPADDLFDLVAFPAGWKLVATDHSMWSDLLDGDGVKRFAVFYKAAFYDRKAHVSPLEPAPDA